MSDKQVIFKKEYEIDGWAVKYNLYRKKFANIAENAVEEFKKYYSSEISNIEQVVVNAEEFGNELINKSYQEIIRMLIMDGVYEIDSETFISNMPDGTFGCFNIAINEIKNRLNEINMELQMAEDMRNDKINSASSTWEGGGFGLEGALMGAATATAMNFATGLIVDIATSGETKQALSVYDQKRLALFNDKSTMESLVNSLYLDIFLALDVYINYLKKYNVSDIDIYSVENINKSKAIFNNLKRNLYNDNTLTENMWINLLQNYPYNLECYTFLLNNNADNRQEILELLEWYGLSKEEAVMPLLESKYSFSEIQQLDEAENLKNDLIKELSNYDIKDSVLLINADKTIEAIKCRNRTYLGIVYDTEEIKKDAEQLDIKFTEWVNSVNVADINALVNLYLYVLNQEKENNKEFPEIRVKHAINIKEKLITNINKQTHTSDELYYYVSILLNDTNKAINEELLQVLNKRIKKLDKKGLF